MVAGKPKEKVAFAVVGGAAVVVFWTSVCCVFPNSFVGSPNAEEKAEAFVVPAVVVGGTLDDDSLATGC